MLMHATRSRAVDGPPLRLYPRDPQRLSQAVRFPKEHLVWSERNLRLARLFSPSREAREKQGSRKSGANSAFFSGPSRKVSHSEELDKR